MIDIRVGDIIRGTLRENPNETITGEVIKVWEGYQDSLVLETELFSASSISFDFEVLERPVVLPTGENAMVLHPAYPDQAPFILQGGKWSRCDSRAEYFSQYAEEEVKNLVAKYGYEVVYEGV